MNTQTIPEIDWTEIEISRMEQFRLLDKRAREIEASYKGTWLELANICVVIRDNELWREGGYHSWNAWLLSACPTARSTAYAAINTLKQLSDIPPEDLR